MNGIDFTAAVEGLLARYQQLKAEVGSYIAAGKPVPAAVQAQADQTLKFATGLLELKGVAQAFDGSPVVRRAEIVLLVYELDAWLKTLD
ncbi:hypothetical protein [Ferrimonas sp. SCSIO 43195]|uniref:hypothetical protein n=1 Tax=Ferrimonas sp. SCSIO 43195 TaxID=2822844 RepID=UPI0020762D1C|nr:hypothetical protein [Ferrimonas sp. SCSIO 43195]USD39123.1 hypothetical protein J8Z22_08495 [Ferrimonas sp. SCSIO 43195]